MKRLNKTAKLEYFNNMKLDKDSSHYGRNANLILLINTTNANLILLINTVKRILLYTKRERGITFEK